MEPDLLAQSHPSLFYVSVESWVLARNELSQATHDLKSDGELIPSDWGRGGGNGTQAWQSSTEQLNTVVPMRQNSEKSVLKSITVLHSLASLTLEAPRNVCLRVFESTRDLAPVCPPPLPLWPSLH